MNNKYIRWTFLFALVASLKIFGSCSSGGGGNAGLCPNTNVDAEVCAPGSGPFSLVIDNGFFPVVVGNLSVLESPDGMSGVEISVLNETEVVAGVTTRVVQETHREDGEVIEISRNFFAQAPDGTVCYYGEEVDNLQNGVVVNNDGTWRADDPGNAPGIIMPANPSSGMIYSQENAPGVAEDQASVQSLGETVDVPAGTFTDTVTTEDCNRLDGATDRKVYARGIGIVIDVDAELISF